MGARGPKKQPTALRVLKGNPSHRPLPKNEVKPPPLVPDCPMFLDAYGRRVWQKTAKHLVALGLLARTDQAIMAAYCDAMSTWKRFNEILKKLSSWTFVTESGYVQIRPEVTQRDRARKDAVQFGARMGLDASSRAGLDIGKGQSEDAGEEVLS